MIYPEIKKVHIVFKTHFDFGFTDFAQNVLTEYCEHFLPKAIRIAEILAQSKREEKFVWTVSAWLLWHALDNASLDNRIKIEGAVKAGYLVWHALPFTSHIELMDASLFRAGLEFSKQLDQRFGKTTIAANHTDVPGMTRAALPVLVNAGVTFLHIGINGACPMPSVPELFLWRDATGAEVIVNYHNAYGGITVLDGCPEALAFEFTRDNLGPHSLEEVLLTYRRLRQKFPNAELLASSLDHFALALLEYKHNLPVVTGEIGDTWIHGVASDPWKVARFRELSRLRRTWLENGKTDANSLSGMTENLLLIAEHTWGVDEKAHLGDQQNYATDDFTAARKQANFKAFEASWQEQRDYIELAIKGIRPLHLRQLAETSLKNLEHANLEHANLEHAVPDLSEFEPLFTLNQPIQTKHFQIKFASNGAISELLSQTTGYSWLMPQQQLGTFAFETFSSQHYRRFFKEYIRPEHHDTWWLEGDFGKPGYQLEAGSWQPELKTLGVRQEPLGTRILLALAMPNTSFKFGAPKQVMLEIFLPLEAPELHFDLRWFDKPASRIPQAIWFSFQPHVLEPTRWVMDKLGQWLSPHEVVQGGNRTLHGVGKGAKYSDTDVEILLETLDAPLLAVGKPVLLRFENQLPEMNSGLHFNLYNNVWGTNFPMWSEGDARFRFCLSLKEQI